MITALVRDHLSIGLALAGVVGVLAGNPVEREFLATIPAEQADGIGPALPAVAHQLGAAVETILKRLQLCCIWTALPSQAVVRTVRRVGNQRHDVMQERATLLDQFVHVDQMLVVDAGIITELIFVRMPRAVSISRPNICRSCRIRAASMPA